MSANRNGNKTTLIIWDLLGQDIDFEMCNNLELFKLYKLSQLFKNKSLSNKMKEICEADESLFTVSSILRLNKPIQELIEEIEIKMKQNVDNKTYSESDFKRIYDKHCKWDENPSSVQGELMMLNEHYPALKKWFDNDGHWDFSTFWFRMKNFGEIIQTFSDKQQIYTAEWSTKQSNLSSINKSVSNNTSNNISSATTNNRKSEQKAKGSKGMTAKSANQGRVTQARIKIKIELLNIFFPTWFSSVRQTVYLQICEKAALWKHYKSIFNKAKIKSISELNNPQKLHEFAIACTVCLLYYNIYTLYYIFYPCTHNIYT